MPLPTSLSADEVKGLTGGSSGGLPNTLSSDEVKQSGGQFINTQTKMLAPQNTGLLGKVGSYLKSGGVGALDFTGPILGIGKNIYDQVKGNVKEASQSLDQSGIGPGKMNPFQAGANIAKNVTEGVLSPINQTLGKIVSPVLSPVTNAINNSPTMNSFNDKLSQVNPNVLGTMSDILGTGLNVASMGVGEGAPEAIKSGIENTKTGILNKVSTKVENEWRKPSTVLNASYNKARAVLEKSPETPKFLTEQRLDPKTHIVDGKYDTEATARALRDTAGRMSKDTLRPSLRTADYSTPKTPVEEITNKTIGNINSSRNVTAGDMDTQIAKAKAEGEVLKKKYPDGMSLTDMHDNNITYAKNGGYSPIDTPDTGNIKSVNRAFGRSLGDLVKNKAPKEIGVDNFQSYLSKYYKAADYLDALQNKKAPVSLGSKIAYKGAQLGGAMAGHALGGGILADVAGYGIGGAIEHALENIPNPIRASFLRNLEVSNPEAFTKVQSYLKSKNSGSSGILQLKQPDFIAPKPPTEETQMKGRANTILK